eukprot:jgi/Mesvir1/13709/Mv06939-RA.1
MNRSRGVITADRAYNMSRESARGSRITEDRIMHTVETVIESSARQGRQFAFYTVPLYQFGLPIYKASEVVKHVGRRLTHRGFRVKQVGENMVYIEWGPNGGESKPKAPPPANGTKGGRTRGIRYAAWRSPCNGPASVPRRRRARAGPACRLVRTSRDWAVARRGTA